MSDILIPCGGGADLGPVTATPPDVRRGKVIVDKNGNPLTGTMAEKGAATYTPGRSNQTIAANQYLTGAQTIRGDTKLLAANIKKGVSIFGVTGTFEGYVPTATDLYLRGNNPAGFTVFAATLQSGGIQVKSTDTEFNMVNLTASKAYNFSGYSRISVNFRVDSLGYTASGNRAQFILFMNNDTSKTSYINIAPGNTYTINIPINVAATFAPQIKIHAQWKNQASEWFGAVWAGWIYHIWMS